MGGNFKGGSTRFGWDKNSVSGDPLFVDPASGDFRVKEGSPALAVGFKNFAMDQFGVKKPSLKAIARTPVIPELVQGKATRKAKLVNWQGAFFSDMVGDQFSAYGVSKEAGGAVLERLPKTSPLVKQGLKTGIVIQEINGVTINSTADLKKLGKITGAATLKVVKNQQTSEVTITL